MAERSDTEELHRLRRALLTLSACNDAVVRATDERAFVQELCELVVEHGYRLAWVGARCDDARRSVEVIAAAGVDDGYTASVNITWDESPSGQGPVGRAIRSGEAAVARSIGTDPSFEPWRQAAVARGYASAIALPYRLADEVAGAVCIYSSESDAFDAHETTVLQELAIDLGQGLQALRERALLRKHASELSRLNDRLQRLARAVQDLSAAHDLPAISAVVRTAARDLASADGATFVLRDRDECHYLDEDAIAPLWKGRRFPISECVSGWAMLNREAVAIHDIYADPRVPHDAYRQTFVKSLAMIPIRREAPVGAIGVYWADLYEVSGDDLRILQALADSTSTALERVRTLRQLEASEERFRSIVENVEDVVFSVDPDGRFEYVSPSIAKYGYTSAEIIGQPFERFVHPADLADFHGSLARTLTGEPETRTFRALSRSGGEHIVRTTSRVLVRGGRVMGVSGVLIDITELRRAEEQLRVAQKMEAVGQLAGGVAHDFNNLLSVILSYAGFVADAVRGNDSISEDVEEIRKAGERAATLTRQLLIFSRKQVLQPQVIDLNQLGRDCEKMLRRLIGEDIELVQRWGPELGRIKADPGQVEQVIMNLCVNARDAMPQGGKLTIETENVQIAQKYMVRDTEVKPGPYVMLAISDTGSGMEESTQQRLFEPFFTTKEVGKGTGLGLSTVYGIVKESGGSIWFYSELGVGTTFKIYFPRLADSALLSSRDKPSDRPAVGSETILLVEDDRAVRRLATRILRGGGYEVVAAADGIEAMREWEQRPPGAFQLLVTDVVMPHMSGKQLAERLVRMQPGLRILYMSGYTDNAIERHGVLEPDTMFIAKPFAAKDLTRKVREVIDARSDRAEHAVEQSPRDA